MCIAVETYDIMDIRCVYCLMADDRSNMYEKLINCIYIYMYNAYLVFPGGKSAGAWC